MARDSSGNYTLPGGNPVVSGEPILSDGWANPTLDDIANELTNSLDRLGRGGMLAPFKFVDGTEASPGMAWSSEPGTGFYRAGSGDMRATVLSQDLVRFSNTTGLSDQRRTGPTTKDFFRVASEKHFYSDDEERGLVVNAITDEVSVSVNDTQKLVLTPTEVIARAPGAGNNVIRWQDDDGVTNRINIFRNGGAATPVSQLRVQTPGESFNVEIRDALDTTNMKQLRLTPTLVALGHAGVDAALTEDNGFSVLPSSAAADDNVQFALKNAAGSARALLGYQAGSRLDLRNFVADGALRISATSLGGAAERLGVQILPEGNMELYHPQTNARRGQITATGAEFGNGGSASGADILRLLMARSWKFQQVGTGGSTALHLISESDGKQFAIKDGTVAYLPFEINTAGDQFLRSSGGVELGIGSAFFGRLNSDGDTLFTMQRAGTDFLQLAIENANLRSIVRASAGRELQLERDGTTVVFRAETARHAIWSGGQWRMGVPNAVNGNSWGSVKDEDDVARPIGYNVMPTLTISGSGTTHVLTNKECGKKIRLNAVNQVLEVVDGLVGDHTCTVWNDSSGDCTIEAGTGITLSRFTGAGKVSGDYTIPSGDRVTLTRRGTSTTWYIG